ncbi:hypothetical protein ACFSTC_47240 [Nonomuraea ferruginea]
MRALAMAVVAVVAVVVLVGGCAAGTTGTGESTHAPPPGADGPVAERREDRGDVQRDRTAHSRRRLHRGAGHFRGRRAVGAALRRGAVRGGGPR